MVLLKAILINLIIYIAFIIPSIIVLLKADLSSKKSVVFWISVTVIITSFLSTCLYEFSNNIFSFFSKTTGVINLCVFISRIVFLDSSLFCLKYIIPKYLYSKNKKTAILFLSKIAANIVFSILGYIFFNSSGLLYSFPICNLIFYIIFVLIFIRI